MKKQFLFSFLLLLFCLPFTGTQAATYTITQNAVFTSPASCPAANVNAQTPNWTGGEVTIRMNHNIANVTSSPNYASNVNNTGWRYFYWDIYNVVNGVEVLETTISKYQRILQGGISNGQFNGQAGGSSSYDYELNMNDLLTAGVTMGEKVIRFRMGMSLTGKSHTINGHIQANGTTQCSGLPLDGNSNAFECDLGIIDCFNLVTCDADLEVNRVSFPWQNGTYYYYYTNMTGGSGNFTYQWWGPGTPNTSTNSWFSFTFSGKIDWVYLTVTDNETGCVYTYYSKYDKFQKADGSTVLEGSLVEALDFQIGPNPASSGEAIQMRFNLDQEETYQVQVIDLQGRVLYQGDETKASMGGEQSMKLPVDLAAGSYFVRINTQQFGSKTKRLIIN